jgi:hypothetical protein
MRWLKIAAGLALVIGLGFAAAHATCRQRAFPLSLPCNASALSAPYHGPLKVVSVASFGCEGRFAYLWATVGKGAEEIGVTEVLAYDESIGVWENASRLTYCVHHRLPAYVRYWGCNSN